MAYNINSCYIIVLYQLRLYYILKYRLNYPCSYRFLKKLCFYIVDGLHKFRLQNDVLSQLI
jgi:hypothetical protein